jgi:glutamate dehydrogenase
VTGERRLAGLFTSTAYHAMTTSALLRGRIAKIFDRSGISRDSHDGKALLAILDSYPRDELFQIDEDALYDHAMGILQLQERRRGGAVRAPRPGRPLRHLPGVRAARALRRALSERFATPASRPGTAGDRRSTGSGSTDSALAQALYTLKLDTPDAPTPDLAELERALADAATSWSDRCAPPCRKAGRSRGPLRRAAWRDWFPSILSRQLRRGQAVADIEPLQAALAGTPFGVRLGARAGMPAHRFTCACSIRRKPIALSDILPLAENLGLRVLSEAPFLAAASGAATAWRCRCCASRRPTSRRSISRRGAALRRSARSPVVGRAGERRLNKLVLGAGSPGARSRAARLRQVPAPGRHSLQPGLHGARPGAYPAIARGAVDLFRRASIRRWASASAARRERLESKRARRRSRAWRRSTRTASCAASSNAVRCSLRTNYWQDKE